MTELEVNSLRICRICLKQESDAEGFRDFFDKNFNFAHQLHFLANITVIEVNCIAPALICQKCELDLLSAYKLKKTAFLSDKFFSKLTRDEEIKLLTLSENAEEILPSSQESEIKVEFIMEEYNNCDNQLDPTIFDTNEEWKLAENEVGIADSSFGDQGITMIEDGFVSNPQDETEIVDVKSSESKRRNKYKKGGSKEGICEICGKNLWSAERLQNHIKVRHEIVPQEEYINCPIEGCSKKFKIQLYVDRHILNMHNTDKKKKAEDSFPCLFCGVFLKSKSALKNHENRHMMSSKPEKILTFACDMCGYRADKKIKVQYHIERVHLHLRKFKCKMCPATFVHASLLQYHELTVHLNIRKFVCRFNCGKSFTRSHCRTIHERIHTNERPYCCKFCNRTFIHHSDWRRHENKHLKSSQ